MPKARPSAALKILMVSPELAPYVKVGGLADVLGALPKALAATGHDVRILCPLHGSIQRRPEWRPHDRPFTVNLGAGARWGRIWEAPLDGAPKVTVYFLEHDEYFGRREVYSGPWGDHSDNGERYSFLSRAAIDLPAYLNWLPDVIHAHDWTTGLVPIYLNTTELHSPLRSTASIFTIHNLEFQGIFPREILGFAGIPKSVFRADGVEAMGYLNMMKGGIYHATKVSTVSPNYADEIQQPAFGFGLNHVLKFRAADLVGILNGIDEESWDPATDKYLPDPFDRDDLSGKAKNKAALQEELGMKVDPVAPIFGVVSRLYNQKGLHLLARVGERFLRDMNVQLVVLGSGEAWIENAFRKLKEQFPGRVGLYFGYNEGLAHRIYAGSDFFVMPSLFEPCGLTQMYAMRYGALPIVRATGGLVDTVHTYIEGKGHGTGFIFHEPSEDALYYTLGWACATYYDRPDEMKSLQDNAMRMNFSWEVSARTYVKLYQWAIDHRRANFPA
jgi:starch synthase